MGTTASAVLPVRPPLLSSHQVEVLCQELDQAIGGGDAGARNHKGNGNIAEQEGAADLGCGSGRRPKPFARFAENIAVVEKYMAVQTMATTGMTLVFAPMTPRSPPRPRASPISNIALS